MAEVEELSADAEPKLISEPETSMPWAQRIARSAKRILIAVLLVAVLLFLLVAQPILPCGTADSLSASPDTLRSHVTTISTSFYPRHCFNRTNLNACAEFIAGRFRHTSAEVTFQNYTIYGDTYRNVRAIFGDKSSPRTVVVAHYDACENTPGADDNASGVAGLLELARLLDKSELKTSVELVAVCTEEPPFFTSEHMGSVHHARLLMEEGVSVRAAIAIEMIGCFIDKPFSQRFPVPLLYCFYPNRANFICVAGDLSGTSLTRRVKRSMRRASDLPVHSISAPKSLPGIDFSDHRSYWSEGIPAVMVTDTAFYRNNRYHGPEDTFDTLDYERMAKVVSGVHLALLDLDEE